jgi:hypothetical protein
MSTANEEYKNYLLSTLLQVLSELEGRSLINPISPKLMYQIDYLKMRINNIKSTAENGTFENYRPDSNWDDIPEVYDSLMSYEQWLRKRRNERADQILTS